MTDYDRWAKIGCQGWFYDKLEPYVVSNSASLPKYTDEFVNARYFQKAECFSDRRQVTEVNMKGKGTNGPWKIRQTDAAAVSLHCFLKPRTSNEGISIRKPISDIAIQARQHIGIPFIRWVHKIAQFSLAIDYVRVCRDMNSP